MASKKIVADSLKIFKKSVSAVLPEELIRRNVKYNPSINSLIISDESYNLNKKNVHLIGTGKAVKSMAFEMEQLLDSKIKSGIISVPYGSLDRNPGGNVQYYEGAKNNLPDMDAASTANKIKNLLEPLNENDILLVLISGGGSALLTLPTPPIQLEDKYELIKTLANAGADITEVNIVRKKLSQLKGGRLASLAKPAQVVALILSDIVGDPLDLIASGPTVHNEDEPLKARRVIDKYNLFDTLPQSIQSILKQTDDHLDFPHEHVKNYIIGSNKISLSAALDEAKYLGYPAYIVTSEVVGNVNLVAQDYVTIAECISHLLSDMISMHEALNILKTLSIKNLNESIISEILSAKGHGTIREICLLFGGETTVHVKGTGKGGRNQHLALEFSNRLHKIKSRISNINIHLLCAGTDGIDGPTNAAGAIGYKNLVEEAENEKINIEEYLKNNDSYTFYNIFKNGIYHVKTGHTNTNVMDVHVMVITLETL